MIRKLFPIAGLALFLAGCNRAPAPVEASNDPGAARNGVNAAPAPPPPVAIPAGTSIPVRLQEALDTRRNRSGDHFTATLDEPLVSGDRVIVPKGAIFSGHVTEARDSGRFKGRAVMAMTLDSFELDGRTYAVRSQGAARASRGHKKRNWLWFGGGSGGGAAIGAIAGGGAGALIGAGAGAGAGTIGAALTGKQHVYLPIETRVSFRLQDTLLVG